MNSFLKVSALSLSCLIGTGCGASDMSPPGYDSSQQLVQSPSAPQEYFQESEGLKANPGLQDNPVGVKDLDEKNGDPKGSSSASSEKSRPDFTRKIIYTANLNLTVESFSGVADNIIRLSQQFGGFVAQANISGNTGNQRHGSWTLRIPTDQYRAFLASAGDLGEIGSLNEQTKEVTAEFYDVDARIRNKQTEEERLNKILEERPGKLDDVLTVEREVSRVREEIERMQGRLRVLQDLTSYSTISITVSEIQHYAPPATPTFATLIHRQWEATVQNMTSVFQALVLWTIAIGPWLLIAGFTGSVCFLVNRRLGIKQIGS